MDVTEIFSLVLAVLFPALIGQALILFLLPSQRLPTALVVSLAYGLGLGMINQLILFFDFVHIPLAPRAIFVTIICSSGILYSRVKYRQKQGAVPKRPLQLPIVRDDIPNVLRQPFIWILTAYIAFQLFYVFFLSLNLPVYSLDGIYFIARKAKVFFYDGSLEQLKFFDWASYPMHSTISMLWVALNMGEWNEYAVKIVFPLTFCAFLVMSYYFLRIHAGVRLALTGVALTAASNLLTYHATIEYSDLSLLYYMCGALILVMFWHRTQDNGYLILASLFAGLGTFTKLEGFSYLLILIAVVLAVALYSRGWSFAVLKSFMIFSAPAMAIYLHFFFYKIIKGVPIIGRLMYDFSAANLTRAGAIFTAIINELFFSNNWNLVWFLLIVTLLQPHRRILRFENLLLAAVIVCVLMFYTVLSFFTSNYMWLAGEQKFISLSRVLMPLYPIAVWLIVLLNAGADDRKDRVF